MKKYLIPLFALTSLFGDEAPSYSLWDYHPLHVGGNAIFIGKANVDAPQKGHLTFNKSNAFVYMLVPVSQTSYFFPRVEWNTFSLDWNKNPKFNKTRFDYIQFGLTFYSTAVEKWRWILRADYNLDVDHFNNPAKYGLFSGFAWGSYEIHEKWHYHVGILGYTGMRGDMVYPVIGADYTPNKKWLFQAVFPINYSIEYTPFERWRFSIRGRPLKERFRAGKNEPQPRSIFSYSSIGAEFNVHYDILRRFEFEIYGGYNFGGGFYIKDQKAHNALYTNIGGAPYGGATLNYGF